MVYQLFRSNLPVAHPIKKGQKDGHRKEEYRNRGVNLAHSESRALE